MLSSIGIVITFLLVLTPDPNQKPSAEQSPEVSTPSDSVTPVSQDKKSPKLGEVTGSGVYVRSGPSTNYYPITRLDMGQRVKVMDVNHGWVSITPPIGCFSLIVKQYVDLDKDNKGIVNADRVWIYAGTDLSSERYAKQVQLNKGQGVTILGEAEEFYKITPPENTRLYINVDYVKVLTDRESASADSEPGHQGLGDAATAQTMPPAPSAEKVEKDQYKREIETLENELEKEFEKSLSQRDLKLIVDRFAKIAEQDQDDGAKQYARYRIKQLERTLAGSQAYLELQAMGSEIQNLRQQHLNERAQIRPQPSDLAREFDVKGKLLQSFAYTNTKSGLIRYRLVDTQGGQDRTIAYIEIEPDSPIQADSFLGRYVGIRAKGHKVSNASVDPIVVYIASEIVILEQLVDVPPVPKAAQNDDSAPAEPRQNPSE